MVSFHACYIFHTLGNTTIFFGQFDTSRQLDEKGITELFERSKKMLIGEAKKLMINDEQCFSVNLEDIIVSCHVSEISDVSDIRIINLVQKIGEAFKSNYQADIDEFDINSTDIYFTFGGFASTLGEMLKQFIESMKTRGKTDFIKIHVSDAAITRNNGLSTDDKTTDDYMKTNVDIRVVKRFPGGIIPPEERDEVLFQEYQEISKLYNTEMINGIIAKVKVYMISNVGQYYEIEVDFSNFPEKPSVSLPSSMRSVLESSSVYNNWNPEDPPSVVSLIAELETIMSYLPTAADLTESSFQTQPRVIESSQKEDAKAAKKLKKEKEILAKKEASEILANTLLMRTKDSSHPYTPITSDSSSPTIKIEEIKDESKIIQRKTTLDSLIHARINQADGLESSNYEMEQIAGSPPAENDRPEAPRQPPDDDGTFSGVSPGLQLDDSITFKIKPKIRFSGDEEFDFKDQNDTSMMTTAPLTEQDQEVPKSKSAPTPLNVAELKKAKPLVESGAVDKKPSFVIPDIQELDSFSPVLNVKKPELKQIKTPPPATNELKTKAKPASPATVERKTRKTEKADIIPGWDDSEQDLEIKPRREIKDFDFQIKKIDTKKDTGSQVPVERRQPARPSPQGAGAVAETTNRGVPPIVKPVPIVELHPKPRPERQPFIPGKSPIKTPASETRLGTQPATRQDEIIPEQELSNFGLTSEALNKLYKILKSSIKMKIDDICKIIGTDRANFLSFIFEYGEKFQVKIDGDYIIKKNTDLSEFF
ncbi:MAG: hypothetical protein ACTSRA_12590 [Promethearchaeota archaeon]